MNPGTGNPTASSSEPDNTEILRTLVHLLKRATLDETCFNGLRSRIVQIINEADGRRLGPLPKPRPNKRKRTREGGTQTQPVARRRRVGVDCLHCNRRTFKFLEH